MWLKLYWCFLLVRCDKIVKNLDWIDFLFTSWIGYVTEFNYYYTGLMKWISRTFLQNKLCHNKKSYFI